MRVWATGAEEPPALRVLDPLRPRHRLGALGSRRLVSGFLQLDPRLLERRRHHHLKDLRWVDPRVLLQLPAALASFIFCGSFSPRFPCTATCSRAFSLSFAIESLAAASDPAMAAPNEPPGPQTSFFFNPNLFSRKCPKNKVSHPLVKKLLSLGIE